MRLQHIIQAVYNEPWLITAGGHASVQRLLEAKMGRARADDDAEPLDASIMVENPRRDAFVDDNGIGHIHICGVIGKHLGLIEKSCGNTDVCDVRREFDALRQQSAKGIMLYVDSPGGTIGGIPEMSRILSDCDIPLYAWTDTIIGSAAYWLASAAFQIWCTPSSEVGSIGVIYPWIDKSARWEMEGLTFAPIVNAEGIYKSAGHGPSFTPEQKEEIQGRVQALFDRFQGFVMARRPMIDSDFMRGQSVMGFDAVAAGLADNLGEFEDAYADLCSASGVFPMSIPDFSAPEKS
ncbi:serine protease, ClpP class [Verrucomicrobium sp. GAS474]|uniref:S49 family peptidase n=1 Tax=Verrucomicrobium sp. GAS474 TaxID=1882831 RepID=UPI000879DA62|nr:S49 family peptidase [Verrucomicrobium sp. GAS474]SDU31257.1 serine protease, ClpP class [Verrucomicrobium sp. GAS474]